MHHRSDRVISIYFFSKIAQIAIFFPFLTTHIKKGTTDVPSSFLGTLLYTHDGHCVCPFHEHARFDEDAAIHEARKTRTRDNRSKGGPCQLGEVILRDAIQDHSRSHPDVDVSAPETSTRHDFGHRG